MGKLIFKKQAVATLIGLFLILIAAGTWALDFDATGDPAKGPSDAPVKVVFFFDFQCMHCARTAPVLLDALEPYGNLVQLVAVNFPSPAHPYAEPAAELALTANESGKFWEASLRLFADQSKVSPEYLAALGRELGLDEKAVSKNLADHTYLPTIKRDFYAAMDMGLNATPTIFVNDTKLVGFQPKETFQYYVNAELEKKGIKSPVGPVQKPKEETTAAAKAVPQNMIYPVKMETPVDSKLRVKVGGAAPDFALPTVAGNKVRLSDYRGKKNIVLSFVPAAFTPVCSGQWPEYNENKDLFDGADTVLIGITADNVPTLYAWNATMGDLWFPIASDFYPHGAVAKRYGVLRKSGTTERVVILIDKSGVIRYIDVHDINSRPDFEVLKKEMKKLAN